MSKKQDAFYFDNFVSCVEHAGKAAAILDSTLRDFHPDELAPQLEAIHTEEHAADCKKHELMSALAKAFITPIEQEDIMLLSQNIDELVDNIEDVLMRIYCNNIRTIRPDALETISLLAKSCAAVKELMVEFPNFKRSKKLRQYIIDINSLEEDADQLFLKSVRELHVNCTEPLEVFSWNEIYRCLENCLDACEHVADIVESVIMKNT